MFRSLLIVVIVGNIGGCDGEGRPCEELETEDACRKTSGCDAVYATSLRKDTGGEDCVAEDQFALCRMGDDGCDVVWTGLHTSDQSCWLFFDWCGDTLGWQQAESEAVCPDPDTFLSIPHCPQQTE